MTRINEVLYFVLYDLCKIKKTQNKSASVFFIGTPEWNRTTAHGSGELTAPQPAKKTYFCSVCHYVYDGATPFEDLPDDYVCPICGKPKSFFITE